MSNEVVISIIGIAGTILGTILGWFLNQLSQRGNLCLFVQNWHSSLTTIDRNCNKTLCNSFDEASEYDFELEIDAYNSSSSTKIMRNIEINFRDGSLTILAYTPDNLATSQNRNNAIRYEKFTCVNIPAKNSTRLKLHGSLDSRKNRNLENTSNVTLSYVDNKNKTKTIVIPFIKPTEHSAQLKEATPNA